MKRLFAYSSLALLLAVAALPARAADNPVFGTWKLNTAKSKFTGAPAPKELSRKIEADGDSAKYTFSGTSADGGSISYSFTTKFDGKDCPVTGNAPSGIDVVSIKKVNDYHYDVVQKKGDKTLSTGKVTISKDSKTSTVVLKGKDANGKAVSTTSVYDKE